MWHGAGKLGITNTKVPLGYMCLDLFLGIADYPVAKVADLDCTDDGIGVCFKKGYFFRPDILAADV